MSKVQIRIMLPDGTGNEVLVTASTDDSVLYLKDKLINVWPDGFRPISSPGDFRLIHMGKFMVDSQSLGSHSVSAKQNGMHIIFNQKRTVLEKGKEECMEWCSVL